MGLYVNLGRVGVGAADVAGCDGDGFARADAVEDGAGAGGAVLAAAVTLVVGSAPMGRPPDGSVLVGSAPLVAVPDDWLDCGWGRGRGVLGMPAGERDGCDDPGRRDRDHHAGHRRRHAGQREHPPPGRPDRLGEAVLPERPGPLRHVPPVRQRPRAGARAQLQDLIAQLERGSEQRDHAMLHGGSQRTLDAIGADVALVDMAVDLLAVRRGQLAVPAIQQHVQLGTRPPAGTGHQQGAKAPLQLAAGPGGQLVRLVPRYAEHRGQVGALQVVPEIELDDLALGRFQPAEDGADELAQLGLIRAVRGVGIRSRPGPRRLPGPVRSRPAAAGTRCGPPRRARAAAYARRSGRRAGRRR